MEPKTGARYGIRVSKKEEEEECKIGSEKGENVRDRGKGGEGKTKKK